MTSEQLQRLTARGAIIVGDVVRYPEGRCPSCGGARVGPYVGHYADCAARRQEGT